MENKKKGFTLIELLTVIGILAVIVVISIVAINGIDDDVAKIGKTISKESVLKAANNYAYEYLIDSNYWVAETTDSGDKNEIYCVNTKTLVNYGFLPKEVKNNEAIKIIKDTNEKITTQIVEDSSACDNSLPQITIKDYTSNNILEDKTTSVKEKIDLLIELSPAVDNKNGKISYTKFYYTLYDENNQEVTNFTEVNCDPDNTKKVATCRVSINDESHDGAYYGTYRLEASVTKQEAIDTAKATFTINKVSPVITINANTPQDEYAEFSLNLNTNGYKYRDFNYTIYDNNNNVVTDFDKIDCDIDNTGTKNECAGSLNKDSTNYYGTYKIKGYVVINSNNYSEVEKEITINNLSPTITFTETGTKGNNNYFISNITVNTTTDDDTKYTKKGLCVFDNEVTDPNSDSWNNCKSPVDLGEEQSGKYVCAKYEVKAREGKYSVDCKQYFIDTSLPSVTISSGSYSSSKINVNANITGDYSDGVKYVILDTSTSDTTACSSSNFTAVTSNTITTSYNSNVSKAIWLKDNAGKCEKKAAFGTGIDSTINYVTDNSSTKTHTISSNYEIKDIIYSNSFSGNVTYEIDSTKKKIMVYDKPVLYDTDSEYVSETCSKSANTYSATPTTKCTKYKCDSSYHTVSGDQCTASDYNGRSSCVGDFYCTCKAGTCLWSYKVTPTCTHYMVNDDGSCYAGWKSYNATNNNPSLTSCTVAQSNSYSTTPLEKSYKYTNTCKWIGDYDATCTSSTTSYSCDSGDYRSGSTCYYCKNSTHTLSGKKCYYECGGYETTYTYSYGRYAVLYTTNI